MLGLRNICIILAIIYLVGSITTFFQNRLVVYIAQTTASNIRKDLFKNIQKLPLKYFDTHSSGDIMSGLTNDVDNINIHHQSGHHARHLRLRRFRRSREDGTGRI